MIKIIINEEEAIIKDMIWTCNNEALKDMLEQYADADNLLFYPHTGPLSPAEPWADMAVVRRLAKDFDVEIIAVSDAPKSIRRTIY